MTPNPKTQAHANNHTAQAEFPVALRAKLDHAIEAIWRDPELSVCAHRRTTRGFLVCAQHPRAGLMCAERCGPAHACRHDEIAEMTCDACGEVLDRIVGIGLRHITHNLPAVDRRGRHALIYGDVFMLGAGLCCRWARCEAAA